MSSCESANLWRRIRVSTLGVLAQPGGPGGRLFNLRKGFLCFLLFLFSWHLVINTIDPIFVSSQLTIINVLLG